MKYVLAIWASPLVLFWGWYFLSLHDINFGSVYLSRQLHDLVFKLYGEMLGIDPASIPMMIAEACAFDTAIIVAIWAFRRRREISAWARERYQRERYRRYAGLEPELEVAPEKRSA
jgi:hypothetical protein